MTKTYNVGDAKTHLSRLLEEVLAGEDVVLARSGHAVARLVPIRERDERELGFLPLTMPDERFDPMEPDELARWS